jgi:hypothetical protein
MVCRQKRCKKEHDVVTKGNEIKIHPFGKGVYHQAAILKVSDKRNKTWKINLL